MRMAARVLRVITRPVAAIGMIGHTLWSRIVLAMFSMEMPGVIMMMVSVRRCRLSEGRR